jgi:hypothetical protein
MFWIQTRIHALLTFIRGLPKETTMTNSATAQIIPFPTQTASPVQAAQPPAIPTPADVRLSRALTNLNNAVIAQREAIAAWKSALGDLRTVTKRLGGSLRTYSDSLGQLDARVTSLRTEAVKLEAWADGVLAKKS